MHRWKVFAAVAVAGTLAIAGVNAVVSRGDNGGVIHACVLNTTGQIRIVTDGQRCRPNETPMQWSVVGPEGPAGPIGPPGPRGDVGSPGRDGATGATGSAGPAGPHGPSGSDGIDGRDGRDGRDGATGPQGPSGPGTGPPPLGQQIIGRVVVAGGKAAARLEFPIYAYSWSSRDGSNLSDLGPLSVVKDVDRASVEILKTSLGFGGQRDVTVEVFRPGSMTDVSIRFVLRRAGIDLQQQEISSATGPQLESVVFNYGEIEKTVIDANGDSTTFCFDSIQGLPC